MPDPSLDPYGVGRGRHEVDHQQHPQQQLQQNQPTLKDQIQDEHIRNLQEEVQSVRRRALEVETEARIKLGVLSSQVELLQTKLEDQDRVVRDSNDYIKRYEVNERGFGKRLATIEVKLRAMEGVDRLIQFTTQNKTIIKWVSGLVVVLGGGSGLGLGLVKWLGLG